MSKVKLNAALEAYHGAIDTYQEGQNKRGRTIARLANGWKQQIYTMKMHEGPWSEGATYNRSLFKAAMKEAHAIDKAAKHPELATTEYIDKAAEWQKLFAEYKATKNPGEKQYATLYSFTYAHLYSQLKADFTPSAFSEVQRQVKRARYEEVLPQIRSLVEGESDLIANMANIAAVLHNTFHFWWTGFYVVDNSKLKIQKSKNKNTKITNDQSPINQELVLGPFQGPVACTRIPYGRGVCGTAWKEGRTVIVPDVHAFPGHIACSSASKSEIVVPIRKNGEIIAVLDIDSDEYNCFDEVDQRYLEKLIVDS